MIYVISDIHGQFAAYMKMLEVIRFSPADTLYIIGDAIDRGADGVKVLQHVMGRDNIILLRGNHEQAMLDAWKDPEEMNHWLLSNGGKPTHAEFVKLTRDEQQRIRGYLRQTPLELHIDVDGIPYHLIHGKPSDDNTEKLWGRFEGWELDSYMPTKCTVFGHTPTILYQDCSPMKILFCDNSGLIGIDCGCAVGKAPGRLGCLCLNDWREYYVGL